MPKTHHPYTPEYRRRLVELIRSGRRPESLAKQFEPSAQAIRNWVRQADLDEGRRAERAARPISAPWAPAASAEPARASTGSHARSMKARSIASRLITE